VVILLLFTGIKSIKSFIKRRNQFINSETYIKLKLPENTREKYISLIIILSVIALLIISLARPLGKEINKEFEGSGRDIVIALDISDSMKANDVKLSGSYAEYIQAGDLSGLSRLDAAKKIVKGFIKLLETDRISLVSFSDDAFPLSPLTDDYDVFYSFLNSIDFSYSGNGSTNIGEAIKVAARRFKADDKSESKIIIIISDGEDHNQDTIDQAKEAKKNNIKIFTVGVGDEKGSRIPLGKDFYGNEIFKKYLDQDVITRLDNKSLKEISALTGGTYFQVKEEDISRDLYKQVNKVAVNKFKPVRNIEFQEFFQVFIFLAIILLTIETGIPLLMKVIINKGL
jgi:Ca-activated chloride channel family protein